MDTHFPAIVTPVFSRPASVRRLLDSLLNATYPDGNIPLVISVEGEADPEVVNMAEQFEWPHGKLEVKRHPERLGLKEHLLQCGDLSEQFGSVIILEEDVMVSPQFYLYAIAAQKHYHGEDAIGGISLYSYEIAENGFRPFSPILDGSDVYFMQVASSWGQLFTATQWKQFRDWLAQYPAMDSTNEWPGYLEEWAAYSWKKHFIRYLAATNRYFVFPRLSLTTVFAEGGISANKESIFQVNLLAARRNFQFATFNNSVSLYDAWYELKGEVFASQEPEWRGKEIEVDLFGTKNLSETQKEFAISIKKSSAPIQQFGSKMSPVEQNILHSVGGDTFTIAKTASFLPANNQLGFTEPRHLSWIHTQIGNWQKIPPADFPGNPLLREIAIGIIDHGDKELLTSTLASIPTRENIQILILATNKPSLSELPPHASYLHQHRGKEAKGNGFNLLFQSLGAAVNTIIPAGVSFVPGAIENIQDVFRKFPNSNWVLPAHDEGQEGNVLRLNGQIFSRMVRSGKLPAKMPLTFWRSGKMQSGPEFTGFISMLNEMFSVDGLSPLQFRIFDDSHDNYHKAMEGIAKTSFGAPSKPQNKWKGTLEPLIYPFYKMNFPGLRLMYILNYGMPRVIKWNREKQYWYQTL